MNKLTLVSNITEGQINTNFDQFLKTVKERVEPYQGLVFNEDQLSDAKATVAELNKMKTEVETRRKEIKKTWLIPYTEFEKKVKKVVSVLDEVIDPLKDQVKEADLARKEEKENQVNAIIETALDSKPTADFIRECEWFYDPKWYLLSITLKKVKSQVEEAVTKIDNDVAALSSMDFAKELLREYKKSGDLANTLLIRDDLKRQQLELEQLEERMKKAEADRAAQVELESTSEVPQNYAVHDGDFGFEEPQYIEEEVQYIAEEPVEVEENMTITFSATGTKSQLLALRNYCDNNRIIIQRV